MIGQIYKIHSDFYYVKPEGKDSVNPLPPGLIECKLREILKKRKLKITVGDFVEIQNGAIVKILERKNILLRPSVSNLDLMLVVSAILEPELDFVQLNRYLTFLKHYKIDALLCFNKDDLAKKEELDLIKDKIEKIYKPLGYKMVFTSALNKDGLTKLKRMIKGKTIALMGRSGAGKSSILNALNPDFNLRTKSVSEKLKQGTHTTRHCEILEFGDFKIIDTPGFSKLTFDFILPKDLSDLFLDIKKYKKGCKFSDCLHIVNESTGCNVVKNIENIDISRYESYLEFLGETKEYKTKITYGGKKTETSVKKAGHKEFAKISTQKRAISRKRLRQNTKNLILEDEEN